MAKKLEDENIGRFTGEADDIEYTPPPDHMKPTKPKKPKKPKAQS